MGEVKDPDKMFSDIFTPFKLHPSASLLSETKNIKMGEAI
jgi:hypothetical protein